MDNQQQSNASNSPDEISLGDVFVKLSGAVKYILSKWLTVIALGVLGVILVFVYAFIQKPVYTATCTFVLEESGRGGALSQYSGLASLAGIDVDLGESGLFQGDNIFDLYRSRLMIEKTLLSQSDFNGKKEQLIERYIDFNHLRKKWEGDDGLDKVHFQSDPKNFDRQQDSIITDLTILFNKKYLSVAKPDKKLNVIEVDIKSKDELFAKNFANNLVDNVNQFYVQTRTKKSYQNVMVLQHQADSVRSELNGQISGVASAIDAAPNANPLFQTLKVPSQKRQVDVQASTAVYAEIVKNLEVAKISLRKDTPLIQLIDVPVLPLLNDKIHKTIALIGGFFIFSILACVWLGFKNIISKR